MKEQQLRTIAIVLNVGGTAEVMDEQKLYKGSYGFIKLQVFAPKTQNVSSPVCTAFCTTKDEFGVKRISSHNYNLLYVGECMLGELGYLLFESYLPKEFTATTTEHDGLEITFNYYDTEPTRDEDGNQILDKNGVPKRHATDLLVSSKYVTTVYPGDWNNEGVELNVNSAEAAQISENMRSIAELQMAVVELRNEGVDVTARENIAREQERAKEAEEELGEQISAEYDRALEAESGLDNQIAEEKSRAVNAETVLQSDIRGLRSDIANEAHFRGYSPTNAEIEESDGTPNDYAYSAESGTTWIYTNDAGWTDSGKTVPDKITPLSDDEPLSAGEPSPGDSNKAARSDHRHAHDATKADKAAMNELASCVERKSTVRSNGIIQGTLAFELSGTILKITTL